MPHTPLLKNWELAAEGITVRIRWFGIGIGYLLVNTVSRDINQPVLNGILILGALYALIDTYWSLKGKVFLKDFPLVISVMEAIFIGLLCHFDQGLDSPFRFYYFLSLIVCAIRHSQAITWSTFAIHCLSFGVLYFTHPGVTFSTEDFLTFSQTLILLGWVTWASTGLTGLITSASRHLSSLNKELQDNQALLEQRIQERTRELQESQALLVQQEKQAAFGLLAAGIAHEVGNPLAAISSLVQLMKRREQTDEYTRERLGMVDDQLRRIQRTLRELVDFSRPATKETTRCDLQEIIDASLSIAKYYKGKKGKQITTNHDPEIPTLWLIRDQLVQVFLNLILNAMDATAEGGHIQIATRMTETHIDITIQDDGSGIPSESQGRLFQPYYTTKPTGTGLGLFVCRNMIQHMNGGTIELVHSSPGQTIFRVTLPHREPIQPRSTPLPVNEQVFLP